jgi:hypothetical protein
MKKTLHHSPCLIERRPMVWMDGMLPMSFRSRLLYLTLLGNTVLINNVPVLVVAVLSSSATWILVVVSNYRPLTTTRRTTAPIIAMSVMSAGEFYRPSRFWTCTSWSAMTLSSSSWLQSRIWSVMYAYMMRRRAIHICFFFLVCRNYAAAVLCRGLRSKVFVSQEAATAFD